MERARRVMKAGVARVVIELDWSQAEIVLHALRNHAGEYAGGSFVETACERVMGELRRVGVKSWDE